MKRKKTVLIIDDIKQFTDLLQDMINTNDDFEVVGKRYDGLEGLEGIKTLEPDLVILDIIMPNLDGLGMLERLQNCLSEGTIKKKPRILVLSAANQESIAKNALSLGADYYMLKPFDFNSLMGRIKQMAYADATDGEDGLLGAEYRLQGLLNEIGVPLHIKGYRYIVEATLLISRQPDLMNKMTVEIYPQVADKFGTNGASVERAIRNAIDLTLERGNVEYIQSYFGSILNAKKGRISNSEFISILYSKLVTL